MGGTEVNSQQSSDVLRQECELGWLGYGHAGRSWASRV